jgi:Lsr2
MAQKIQTLFIDDIDGSAAEGTVRFGLDGTNYEIDLSAAHAADLRAALAPFIAVSRKAPGAAARRPARAGRKAAADGTSTTEVREWAKTQGIEVKDRGRIPAGIVARYRETTGK